MRPMLRWLPLCLLVGGFFSAAGCSFDPVINVKYKWTLKPGEVRWYVEESDPGGQRKVNVSMTAFPKGSNVMVAVIFKEDLEDAKKAMKEGNEPPKHLRSHPGGDEANFEPVVLAKGKPFAVVVRNGVDEGADIELKISSK